MRRVDEAIRQVLGDAVTGELKDPRVGFVTVTDVRTSADLRHARVYVSVLGESGGPSPEDQREATLDGLRSAHGYLQGRLASELRLKRTPTLEFAYDDTTDRALRVDELLESEIGDAREREHRVESTEVTRERVLERIREDSRFVLAAHEGPDGDALGSLVGMQGLLTALGKDSQMFIAPEDLPLPYEYRFFALDGADPVAAGGHRPAHGRVPGLRQHRPQLGRACCSEGTHLLNIDHHHDNTRFGTLDHVVPDASCTAEIVWDLMHGLGVRPTPEVARALYVGLITDTGRFMYENTGPRAHEMAAELIDAGVDVQDVYRRLYEEMPAAKIALLALALGRMRRFDSGELTLAALSAEDFRDVDAEDSYSEGIIDHLRAVQGTKVAALVRELSDGERARAGAKCRCAPPTTTSTCRRSRASRAEAGTGAPPASPRRWSVEPLIEFLRRALAAQLHASTNGPAPRRSPERRYRGEHAPGRRARRWDGRAADRQARGA